MGLTLAPPCGQLGKHTSMKNVNKKIPFQVVSLQDNVDVYMVVLHLDVY